MIMPSRSTRNRAFLLSAALATASFSGTTLAEELRLITWGGYAPDDVVAQFEEETGIDVQVTLSNNEDMISKLRATGGAGFDLAEIRLDDGVLVQGRVASDNLRTGHRAELYIRPESLVLSGDALSAGFSSMQAKVRTTLFDGANSRVEAENCGQPVYARLPQDGSAPRLSADSSIRLAWNPALARVFGAESL